MFRGRRLAAAAITYLLAEDEDLEPENSRTALVLAPGKSPSVLDVAVVAAQKVRGARPPYPAARVPATHRPSPGAVGKNSLGGAERETHADPVPLEEENELLSSTL